MAPATRRPRRSPHAGATVNLFGAIRLGGGGAEYEVDLPVPTPTATAHLRALGGRSDDGLRRWALSGAGLEPELLAVAQTFGWTVPGELRARAARRQRRRVASRAVRDNLATIFPNIDWAS